MIVTDLDGTLLDNESRLSPTNRDVLHRLGDDGVVRVITTGRSLYSARLVIDNDFPIDYLSFSSGAGTVRWSSQELISTHNMSPEQAESAAKAFLTREMDFMIHHGVPDNHHFYYHRTGAQNPDFERRCARYGEFAVEWNAQPPTHSLCQLLGVEPPSVPSRYEEIAEELAELTVILTTSPLDHQSRWIEVFPPQVSKSQAAITLAQELDVPHDAIVAVGNDFNDRDLLTWAHRSFVVANAPAELLEKHAVVDSNCRDGFAQAAAELFRR